MEERERGEEEMMMMSSQFSGRRDASHAIQQSGVLVLVEKISLSLLSPRTFEEIHTQWEEVTSRRENKPYMHVRN